MIDKILPFIYLGYMFISVYFLSFYFLLYLRNRHLLWTSAKLEKKYSVSVLIPAYNEQDSIKATVKHVLDSDYDNIKEILILNDGSTDSTKDVAEKLAKQYSKVRVINKKNSGKADSLNYGIKIAKSELIAVVDADSYPRKDAIRKLVAYFSDDKVGASTCPILVRNKNKFFEKLQAIEYAAIAITRKLLEAVDAIYVTPGPLALYRKKALQEIGGFDPNNMTEDIEITWNLTAAGWKRKMCLTTKVTTSVPEKFRLWFRQRKRWSVGGMQTVWKYRHHFFKRDTMIGHFILPFFVLSTFLGLVGLGIFTYLILSRIIRQYFLVQFSFVAQTAVVSLDRFYFTPSVLNYLGIVLFLMGSIFTFFVLMLMKEDIFKRQNIFVLLIYLTVYLAIYPFIMVAALIKWVKRDMKW